jgi:hypothetical protein
MGSKGDCKKVLKRFRCAMNGDSALDFGSDGGRGQTFGSEIKIRCKVR